MKIAADVITVTEIASPHREAWVKNFIENEAQAVGIDFHPARSPEVRSMLIEQFNHLEEIRYKYSTTAERLDVTLTAVKEFWDDEIWAFIATAHRN